MCLVSLNTNIFLDSTSSVINSLVEFGKSFIHEYRGLEDKGETVFTNALVKEKDLPNSTNELISELIESKNILVFKETKHTNYYIINKR